MFRNIFIFALFATCLGYAFADALPPVLEPDSASCGYDGKDGQDCGVFEQSGAPVQYYDATGQQEIAMAEQARQVQVYADGNYPVWPIPGTDADMQLATTALDSGVAYAGDDADNIRIVSKIGADMVVENNINMGGRGFDPFAFSGGANLTHEYQAPQGFNIYENQAAMPLMHSEMMEDDGASVLAMSRSGRIKSQRQIMMNGGTTVVNNIGTGGNISGEILVGGNDSGMESDIAVSDVIDTEDDDAAAVGAQDQVRSWVVASGSTLHEVLQDWANKEGWDLVWGTSREYPIQASAVFKGRFLDVSSALVRNFSRANPVPYAKFYKGNRVVVVSTASGE
ncbi:MAG: toxin co-regulated pilus biosynthesis Q family protein [Rickettsiales bacterium]|jgi:hypothetical protein|nr:toxin co-regulated pilus biosynthesis Q family protein [Rickettsiales bacterium]